MAAPREVTSGSSAGHQRAIARFGPFEAHLQTGELFRNGVKVPLQQQPFRLLRTLLTRPGELVTREDLRRRLWGDDTFVAFERGLTSAVRKVREALGDRADGPLYIETLHGRGYRFMAPVAMLDRLHPSPQARAAGVRPVHRFALSTAVVVVLLAAGPGGRSPGFAQRLAAAEMLSQQACQLKSQGRFDEGLAAIKRAHDIAPESAKITAELGMHLHAAKQYEAELPTLLLAVSQDQYSPDAWLHLGLGYARRSEFAAAVPALERAVALEAPGKGRAQYWLRWAQARRTE